MLSTKKRQQGSTGKLKQRQSANWGHTGGPRVRTINIHEFKRIVCGNEFFAGNIAPLN
jgi:hypothetical protein